MIRLFYRIKDVFFFVRRHGVCLIPVIISLLFNPFFPFPAGAAKAATLSKNQVQRQTAEQHSKFLPPDVSAKDPLEKPPIIYNGPDGALLKFRVKADFLETFTPEIDIFQNKNPEFDETFVSSGSAAGASDHRFEIFRLEQRIKDFNYGLEYRYVGKNLDYINCYKQKAQTKTKFGLQNDQEGVEIWGEKKIQSVGLKTFFSRFWDNVDRDPTLPRMLTYRYGLEMNFKMDLLPVYVSFSHLSEESRDTFELENSEYQGKQKKAYNSSLRYHGGKAFDITAFSNFSFSHDLYHPDEETQSTRHGISSSIHPASNLTIIPALSFGEYRYLWDGEHRENPSASLSISYGRIFNIVDLSLRGRYSQTKNTDRSLDTERLDTTIGLKWNANNAFFSKIGYSLDFRYNQYLDNIHEDNSYNTLCTSFKLEFQL